MNAASRGTPKSHSHALWLLAPAICKFGAGICRSAWKGSKMGIELPRAVRSRSSPLTCTAHRRGLGPRARETPRVCGANLVSAVRAVTVEKATNVASGRVRPWRDPRGTTESARTSWHKIRLLSGRSELGAGRGVAASGWCMWVWARVFERNMRPGWRIVRWEGWCSHKDSSNKGNLYSLSLSLPSFLIARSSFGQ